MLVAIFSIALLLTRWGGAPLVARLLVYLLMVAPLAVRRRYPVASAYLVLIGGAVQLVFFMGSGPAPTGVFSPTDVALGIMMYTLAVSGSRRSVLLYTLWLAVGIGLWAVGRVGQPGALPMAAIAAVTLALCWAIGAFAGARRAYHTEVEQRLKLLETERDQQARIAVAEERTRIARELHDVVAHAVSAIVVQADGAGYAIHSHPELAERAVRTISATGREALAELRRLLGVLREDDEETDQRAPQPGIGGLAELAERVNSFGMRVRLRMTGDLRQLPAGIGLGVYRIVQEALTNTFKHAGAGAAADVAVNRDGDTVTVEICDNGALAPARLAGVTGGNGLIGMRERASMFGGTVCAGPRQEGGWRVYAELPLPSET